jgi:hypothetical protein
MKTWKILWLIWCGLWTIIWFFLGFATLGAGFLLMFLSMGAMALVLIPDDREKHTTDEVENHYKNGGQISE